MGPVHWRDELPEKSLDDVMSPYPWFKSAQSLRTSPKKNKGSLVFGNPRTYSPLARDFVERDKHAPARLRAAARTATTNAGYKHPVANKENLTSKLNKKVAETTWLQNKITQYFHNPVKERLGELPAALVKVLWGSTRESADDNANSDAATDDLIRKLTKMKKKDEQPAECLMDVLLQSWTYFSHSHSKVKTVDNHVHAKYCENAFGHFLLPDGTQVHGSYVISLRKLINELRALLARLKSKVTQSAYKVVPTWRPPQVEEVAEFALPPFKEVPPLYPIKGLLKAPKEDVPANSTPPLFLTPTPIPHPVFVVPALIKAPRLNIPTLRDFSVERKSINYSLEHVLPLPFFVPPEQLPLPVWQEPEQQPLPPKPQLKELGITEAPIFEPLPPYAGPVVLPRPCEASYYPVSDFEQSICDGLCGNTKNPWTGQAGRCLARPPTQPSPIPPLPPEIQIHQEPVFEPPPGEPIPEFKPPILTPEPKYVQPPNRNFFEWNPLPAPDPIGYLAGTKPLFLVECSNTMTGERMKVAQEAVRYLFSKRGQVDIAASHFDIIMYSFDAWSYGALEEERQYKLSGGPVRRWLKNLEVMQPKTPANVDKALTWMSKWRIGGRSNLLKALEVAFQRQSADCIYLLTDGKPERPVLVMNTLKKWAKERGKLPPVYPVCLGPSKRGGWFMKNIAEATGGQLRELDLQWQLKMTPPAEGVAAQDREWIHCRIEEEQRRNLELGHTENIDSIRLKVKKKFEVERQGPRYAAYLEEERKAMEIHRRGSDMIKEENMKATAEAKRKYDELTESARNRNKEKYDHSWKMWEEEVQNVRAFNLQWKKLQDDWERLVMESEDARTKSIEEARKAFLEDVRRIEDSNAHQKEHSKQLYDAQLAAIKEKNEKLKRDTEARQEEMAAQTEAHNRELTRQYEERCSEISALNASLLDKARADFSAARTAIDTENRQKLEEAEQEFAKVYEEVNKENLRRQNEYKMKMDDLDVRMKDALTAHQEQVAAIVAEHDNNLAKIAAINSTLEERAKRDWEEVCKRIDEENKLALDTAVKDWEATCRAIQEENKQQDRRRLEQFERAAEIDHLNEEIVKKKKEEWKETCRKLELQYQEEIELARVDHQNYVKDVERRNQEALEAAKVAHSAQLAAAETYNETIRPYVESSKLFEKEIHRINLFLKHIVDKLELAAFQKSTTSRKHTLEQRLDLLSGKEQPCHPRIIVEALQIAYDDDVNSGTSPEKSSATRFEQEVRGLVGAPTPTKPRSKFEGMVPISPIRVTGHHCHVSQARAREHSMRDFFKKAVTRQHEIAVMIAPMVKVRG